MRAISMILLLCFYIKANCQLEFNNWYFGNGAGISFSSGSPVAVTNGVTSTTEGCASISDDNGNLLFYTDGVSVFNRNHLLMTNGNGLNGHASSTQSGIIIQKPLSNSIYYIFTADADVGADGIQYSEVDLSLLGGLGAVTANKNILLHTPSCEKLTAVRHCNNLDIWVISHDWGSNGWRSWLVTSAGVNLSPILSNAGSVISGATQSSYGQLKANSNGDRLVACYYGFASSGTNRMELYRFNNQTGIVNSPLVLASDIGLYGCEFSADGTMVYGATNSGLLLQFQVCGTNSQIFNSRYVVGSLGPFIGSLQLGPDSRIYIARNTAFLSVINNPSGIGASCSFVNNSISLIGRSSRMGLPNICNYYMRPRDDITWIANCLTVQFQSQPLQSSCNSSLASSISWNFGDGTTSNQLNPIHTFPAAGTYSIQTEIVYPCYNSIINTTLDLSGQSIQIQTQITQ